MIDVNTEAGQISLPLMTFKADVLPIFPTWHRTMNEGFPWPRGHRVLHEKVVAVYLGENEELPGVGLITEATAIVESQVTRAAARARVKILQSEKLAGETSCLVEPYPYHAENSPRERELQMKVFLMLQRYLDLYKNKNSKSAIPEDNYGELNKISTLNDPEKAALDLASICYIAKMMTPVQCREVLEMDTVVKVLRFLETVVSQATTALDPNHVDMSQNDPAYLALKVKHAPLSDEARSKLERELARLRGMSGKDNREAETTVDYINTVLSMPWGQVSKTRDDIPAAKKTLDESHYGLDAVKKKILIDLAVRQRTEGKKGKILCLVGPPGVGKTSIAKSIAEATGRKYVRMALGGVRDEAEIRGHRRTYISSIPGRVMECLKEAGTTNPVFVLDEIDKLSEDPRGNPKAALLEVLDPEQNNAFRDHYLDIPFDLSGTMFIATANDLESIPGPLRDRMDIIDVRGYTMEEKCEIARRYLVPAVTKDCGLKEGEFSIDDAALMQIATGHTREAGVRQFKRLLTDACGQAVADILSGEATSASITPENLEYYVGKPKIVPTQIPDEDKIGVVNGLAWTPGGGTLLQLEGVSYPSQQFGLIVTGSMGEVMKESVEVAKGLIRARASELGISQEKINSTTIQIHAPDGATKKDGPSAGIDMATAIASLLTGRAVLRNIAMTGELSLQGLVLPVGGIAAKLEAAAGAGAKTVLIPKANFERDMDEVPQSVKDKLEIIPVSDFREVFRLALAEKPASIGVEGVVVSLQRPSAFPSGRDSAAKAR